MAVTAEIVRLIDARIGALAAEKIKHKLDENEVAFAVSTTSTKILTVEWQQSRYADVDVNLTLTGQASQTAVLTGSWQLDSGTVLAPVQQSVNNYDILTVMELLHAVAPGKHKLDFYLSCSAGTFTINAFSAKMYVASTSINGTEMQPKINITETFSNAGITFVFGINTVPLSDVGGCSAIILTPIPILIQETYMPNTMSFSPPSLAVDSRITTSCRIDLI